MDELAQRILKAGGTVEHLDDGSTVYRTKCMTVKTIPLTEAQKKSLCVGNPKYYLNGTRRPRNKWERFLKWIGLI